MPQKRKAPASVQSDDGDGEDYRTKRDRNNQVKNSEFANMMTQLLFVAHGTTIINYSYQ